MTGRRVCFREIVRLAHRGLSFEERARIEAGIQTGPNYCQIGKKIGRDHTLAWRERHRNTTKATGYTAGATDTKVRVRRVRPTLRELDTDLILAARVLHYWEHSRNAPNRSQTDCACRLAVRSKAHDYFTCDPASHREPRVAPHVVLRSSRPRTRQKGDCPTLWSYEPSAREKRMDSVMPGSWGW